MAYGAYGVPVEFGFNSELLSLLDRGFVYAVIHARGGGERGVAWHKGGSGRNKIVTGMFWLASSAVLAPLCVCVYTWRCVMCGSPPL